MSSMMQNNQYPGGFQPVLKGLQEQDKQCDHCRDHFNGTPCDADLRMLTACTTCTFRQGGERCVVDHLEMLPRPPMLHENAWDELRQVCDSCHLRKKQDCSWLDGGVLARQGPCTNCQAKDELCTRDGNEVPLPQGDVYTPGLFGRHWDHLVEDNDGDVNMPDHDLGAQNDMTHGGQYASPAHESLFGSPGAGGSLFGDNEPIGGGAFGADEDDEFSRATEATLQDDSAVQSHGLGPRYEDLAQTPAPYDPSTFFAQPQPSQRSWFVGQSQPATLPQSQSGISPSMFPAQHANTAAGSVAQSQVQPPSGRVLCPECPPGSSRDFSVKGLKMHIAAMHRRQHLPQPSQVNGYQHQAPTINGQHYQGQNFVQAHQVHIHQSQQPQYPVPQPQHAPGQPVAAPRYSCDFCGKDDFAAHGLKVHMKLKHPNEEVPSFAAPQTVVCPYCHGDYQARGLGVHILHRHPGMPCPDLKDFWQ